MKVGSLINANDKGQIVIPKAMREHLGINSGVVLNIQLVGQGIYVYPVSEVIGKTEAESSYLQLLAKTRGAWAGPKARATKQRSALELQASAKRKRAW